MDGPWTLVCFSGVDWRSHRQRPHWLMSSFAERGADVLFVDNLGTRMPRLRDASRVVRRMAGWARTTRRAGPGREHGIRVDSPVVLPLQHLAPVRAIGRATLVRRIRRRIRRRGPLVVWTYLPLPVIADTAKALDADLLVYDWADDAPERMLSRSARQRARVARWEDEMAARADLVFVASAELLRSRGSRNEGTHVVPHGTGARHRRGAPASPPAVAEEIADLRRPRIGFVGSVSDWIDLPLIESMARSRPEWSFVMVGPVKTRLRSLRRLPNVTFTGERAHEAIPGYLAGFDVGIIPYRVTPATTAASPVKLREYLAAGLPVVSADLPEVRPFAPPVRVAAGPEGFLESIEAALREGPPVGAAARAGSWDDRADEMLKYVSEALAARG